MRLDPFVRDYRAFMTEFSEVLEAERTRFYLDTSLLMWLIRLGARARAEFIGWCDTRPDSAVRVPVWAAHELHRHLIAGTVRSNVQKTLSDTQAKYDEFARLASERADEGVCLAKGYAGRDSYVGELERSVARLNQLARVVDPEEAQLNRAAEEVISFVNTHVLSSDVRPLVEELSLTGVLRFSHHMPPGFHDKKDENRYGDVIIWEEMIADLASAKQHNNDPLRDAVLVSRDKKTDWVSSAPIVRNLAGDLKKSNRDEELDVTLAHPLLVHEFGSRAHGNRLYVTHPGFLASTLDFSARRRKQPHRVGQWLAASHRPDLLGRLAGIELTTETTAVAPAQPLPDAQPSATTPLQERNAAAVPPREPESVSHALTSASVLDGETAHHVMAPAVITELRLYQDAVPVEQPDLIVRWVAEVRKGELSPYKFGRIIAELSVSGAAPWPEQLPAVIEQLFSTLSSTSLNALVLAVATSVYFDRYGELLRRPHAALGAVVLALETDDRLQSVFRTLRNFLAEANAILPYVPGTGRSVVRFVVDLVPGAGNARRIVRDIRIGQHSALAEPVEPGSSRRLSALLGRLPAEGCTGRELRMLVAREYLVPAELLNSDLDTKKLTWPPDAGLVILDTESEGGLSTMTDEEDNND